MTGSARLTREHIHELFDRLNEELAEVGTIGELYLVGGAVMYLALNAGESTVGVDTLFEPTQTLRESAAHVGAAAGVGDKWLNAAVEGVLGAGGASDPFLDLPHLRVFVPHPEYLLAMKCAAMRLHADVHDLDDVRYLLRWLNITELDEALAIVTRYFDEEILPPKTRPVLEEMLA
ncbi:MAG: hypothetical protein ACC667_09510 [Longimicrobiales bacterium]